MDVILYKRRHKRVVRFRRYRRAKLRRLANRIAKAVNAKYKGKVPPIWSEYEPTAYEWAGPRHYLELCKDTLRVWIY